MSRCRLRHLRLSPLEDSSTRRSWSGGAAFSGARGAAGRGCRAAGESAGAAPRRPAWPTRGPLRSARRRPRRRPGMACRARGGRGAVTGARRRATAGCSAAPGGAAVAFRRVGHDGSPGFRSGSVPTGDARHPGRGSRSPVSSPARRSAGSSPAAAAGRAHPGVGRLPGQGGTSDARAPAEGRPVGRSLPHAGEVRADTACPAVGTSA